MIRAGIDEYSRRLVYISCSTDNRADAVLQLFVTAVDYHGLLFRVRGDVLKTVRLHGLIYSFLS